MNHLLKTYKQYPGTIVRGEGSYVWDGEGKKYLDFYGGHAVCIIGHCPPAVVSAIAEQSKTLMFYSNIFETNPAVRLAELLAQTLKPESYQVYFANSGSEANETALKIARRFTGKKHVISFKNSFHGRGIYPLGVTGIGHYHQFEPNVLANTSFAQLGNIADVERLITNDTAAVICEPIQSVGGVTMAPHKFYEELAVLCHQKKIVLIFDEVQTGLGRTGKFWFSKKLGIVPDIITTAKGLASGLPISAVLISEKISTTIKQGEHATTFGGGPVVCAAGVATIGTILGKDVLGTVEKKSKRLNDALMKLPGVSEVRGEGLLLAIKFHTAPEKLVEKCLAAGLIIGSSGDPAVFRLLPPITISEAEIDECLGILKAQLTHPL